MTGTHSGNSLALAQHEAHSLSPLNLPLHGSRLIEASAGTGKTWTIAALYLRLVLGHGAAGGPKEAEEAEDADEAKHDTGEERACGFHRPLLPSEILVMTFTRAATKELSDRIRARLIEAARCFRGDAEPPAHDTLLAALIAAYPDSAARDRAAWRLAMAAEAMDDAAVFTIDAWCQRMLREHAFDSGNPFDEELAADEAQLRLEATQDYWRQQCYPLAGAQLEVVLAEWPDVHALHDKVGALVGEPLAVQAGDAVEGSLGACIARALQHRDDSLNALAAGWEARAQSMQAWLDAELAHRPGHWNRSKLQARYYAPWFTALQAWARNPTAQALTLPETACTRLTPAGLQEARKPDAPPLVAPDDFAAFAALIAEHARLPGVAVALSLHAATGIARRLVALKRAARSFGFADMLERLDRALSGPHGARLRERIVTQYPVALIDEFQDTSPLQYRLFDALYRTADNDPRTALLLIGDPKQSIYGFRGADIYSYLQARRATAGRHYVLDTNYRSSTAMVAAVNHWFARAESRGDNLDAEDGDAGGAFLFRGAAGNALPFVPVAARGRDEVFCTGAGPVAALTIRHDLELQSSADARRRFAAHCAERIVTWLNDADAGFRHADGRFTRLRPADIAVLVRTGKEAEAVRHALRRRGVASVYLSDKDSVFASAEARDLLHWLRAAATPRDAPRVRAALATRSIGLSIAALAELAGSDAAFDRQSETLHQLHAVWRDLGVLAMLRRTLHLLDLPARWLSEDDGERRLTNFLHLAELLQQAGAQHEGQEALIRWLATQIENSARSGDEQVVRLESDADLVKVVTIHKSKGLEYPVVCLPFGSSFRNVERRYSRYLKLADAAGVRTIKLEYSDEELGRADLDRLREDVRLFYVALTRARHALWMGFTAVRKGNGKHCMNHLSAPGVLLAGREAREADAWLAPLEALAAQANDAHAASASGGVCIALEAAPEAAGLTRLQARETPPPLIDSPVYAGDFERRWSIGSFSALVRDIAPGSATPTALAPLQTDGPADDELTLGVAPAVTHTVTHTFTLETARAPQPGGTAAAPPDGGDLAPWHRFPGGALVGNFLHELLECIADDGFMLEGNAALEAELRRRCVRADLAAHAEDAVQWMRAIVSSPLPGLSAPLRDIGARLPEMEFWMPAAHLAAPDIDRLCRHHLLGGRARPALPQRELHGMLMGFADLVFEHQGRYWVLDYKSNRLGTHPGAYDHAALEAAMAHSRYDVQAALYLLALHRLLRQRLGAAYDPDRQLGGALYLFLRGLDGPARGEYVIRATPETRTLIDALDTLICDEASLA